MTANYLPTFVIAYSESSFTNPHQVVLPDDPKDSTGDFTHMGARYWGFETSRHKATKLNNGDDSFCYDHDAFHWIRIGLVHPSTVAKITISTKWFTGNQVPEIAIDLVNDEKTTEVVSRSNLQPDQEHVFEITPSQANECVVRCYHEGGIARINLFGEVLDTHELELADTHQKNLLEDALISHVSNEHYGHPQDAVKGGRTVDYMLGWESARSGFGESALFHLKSAATISEIVVDTYLHRLNSPLSCHVFGLQLAGGQDLEPLIALKPRWSVEFDDGHKVIPENFAEYMSSAAFLNEPVDQSRRFAIRLHHENDSPWHPLISFGRLRPDTWHSFNTIEYREPVTHLLYMHYPNGGIHGLKVFGTPT